MSIQFRIIAALVALVALMAAGVGIHMHGVSQGKKLERADWQAKELVRQQDEKDAILDRIADNERVQRDNDAKNRKVSDDYENRMAVLRKSRDAARAARDANPADGLRIDRAAGQAETAGDRRRDEAAAAYVLIPAETERRLFDLADDADEIVEQARACQNWIKTHGFYGETE